MRQEFGKFLNDTGLNAKKEEVDAEVNLDKGGKAEWEEDESSSLGLVFAGSRMGDSTLMVFNLKENMKLVPLELDEDQEKAKSDALEMLGQTSKRKRDVNNDDDGNVGIKKEKLEYEIDEPTSICDNSANGIAAVSDDEMIMSEEEILQREEDILYAGDLNCEGSDANTIVTPHDDRNTSDETLLPGITSKQLYRPQIRSMSVFQHTQVIDCLTGLGPIGPGCSGPTPVKESKDVSSLIANATRTPAKSSQTNIHPCGFGSSGGLAVLNTPGLNTSSTIQSEIDCLDIGAVFPCTDMGYFFVVKKGENAGCIVMKIANEREGQALEEVDIDSLVGEENADGESPIPSFQSVRDVLSRMEIISVKEFKASIDNSTKCIFMTRYGSAYALVVMCQEDSMFRIEHSHFIGVHDDGMLIDRENLVSVSFVEHLDKSRVLSAGEDLFLTCVWSSGHSSIFTISYEDSWIIKELLFAHDISHDSTDSDKDGKNENIAFYKSGRITAVDIFAVADSIFESTKDIVKDEGQNTVESAATNEAHGGLKFDVDDIELYGEEEIGKMTNVPKKEDDDVTVQGEETSQMAPSRYNTLGGYISGAGLSDSSKVVVAISRQSGNLEIYDVAKLFSAFDGPMVQMLSDSEAKLAGLLWISESGCGQGASILNASTASRKRPKSQESCTTEMRFFFSGPAESSSDSSVPQNLAILRSLCLLIETTKGDTHLYSASKSHLSEIISFKRVSLNSVSRPSKDEAKHRNKLRRKGMAKESAESVFRSNRLHRFFSISGQDGLFAATSRPMWYLSERGAPSALCHRLRHAAPSGGADVPIAGFCAGFVLKKGESDNGFITVHDRIGRVGSQRLTLFNG
jgi:cleavage and polyadenylation specificity factor subunit 1